MATLGARAHSFSPCSHRLPKPSPPTGTVKLNKISSQLTQNKARALASPDDFDFDLTPMAWSPGARRRASHASVSLGIDRLTRCAERSSWLFLSVCCRTHGGRHG